MVIEYIDESIFNVYDNDSNTRDTVIGAYASKIREMIDYINELESHIIELEKINKHVHKIKKFDLGWRIGK